MYLKEMVQTTNFNFLKAVLHDFPKATSTT